jgi:hypothetical protein
LRTADWPLISWFRPLPSAGFAICSALFLASDEARHALGRYLYLLQ